MKKFTMHPMNPIKWFFFYVGIFAIGWEAALYVHSCPLPSVEQVQTGLNEAKPDWQTPLEVDGVAGPKTVSDWMMYSTTWEAENIKEMCK